jgi:hypothetical protein
LEFEFPFLSVGDITDVYDDSLDHGVIEEVSTTGFDPDGRIVRPHVPKLRALSCRGILDELGEGFHDGSFVLGMDRGETVGAFKLIRSPTENVLR